MSAPDSHRDIAITGMAALFPGATDLLEYWRNIVDGVDATGDVSPQLWLRDATGLNDPWLELPTCRRGGFIEPVSFDPIRYGFAPSDFDYIEPDQLIALKLAMDALTDAGLPHRRVEPDRVGIVLGRGAYPTPGIARFEQKVRGSQQMLHVVRSLAPQLSSDDILRIKKAFADGLGYSGTGSVIGLVPNLAASRLANRLDLHGPAYTIDAACASSLLAVDQSMRMLRDGTCDIVLAGGIHHCHDLTFWHVFEELGALSKKQCIRPFDSRADGLLISEGTGLIVLKRAIDAYRDGDRIYAVIKGSGTSSDGRTGSLMSPQSSGQIRAVQAAWADASLDPAVADSIDLIEAHGTATVAGDQAELATLAAVFGPVQGSHAVLGSVKSMIGHAMPAAGIAALIKTALALYHAVFPPSLHCESPNKLLASTRFKVIPTWQPWVTHGARKFRRAGVNAFGFGGINAHLVLESLTPDHMRIHCPGTVAQATPPHIGLFQATTIDELKVELQRALSGDTGATAMQAPTQRLAIWEPTPERLAKALTIVTEGHTRRGRDGIWYSPMVGEERAIGKVAFLFPGLDTNLPVICEQVAQHFRLAVPDMERVAPGDVMAHAGAVMDAGSFFYAVTCRLGIHADATAGHSIGELAAFAAAGGLPDVGAARIACRTERPTFPNHPYAAVSMSSEAIAQWVSQNHEHHLVVSHENASEQTIVCGTPAAIDSFVHSARGKGYFAQTLPFVSGLHTPMFAPYLSEFRKHLLGQHLATPYCNVWSATICAEYPSDPDDLERLAVRHLTEPVKFFRMIRAMYKAGFRTFIQMGSGQLATLVDGELRGQPHLATSIASTRHGGLESIQRMLLDLWSFGLNIDPCALYPRNAAQSGLVINLSSGLVSLDAGRHQGLPQTSLTALPGKISAIAVATHQEAFASMVERAHADVVSVLNAAQNNSSTPLDSSRAGKFRVSIETMPFLLDHSLVPQSERCQDNTDRWPVVPGTTLIEIMREHAEAMRPGEKIIGIEDIQFKRWMDALPARDIDVKYHTSPVGHLLVKLDDYCQATFKFGANYVRPSPYDDPAVKEACHVSAESIYTDRWMFHGPAFRGISEIIHCGPDHLLGKVRALPTKGATLDNIGQLVGFLIKLRLKDRSVAFPHRIKSIDIHGEPPIPGDTVDIFVHGLKAHTETVHADIHATVGKRPWLTIKQWSDYRFSLDPSLQSSTHFPERYPSSTRMPEGWNWIAERCSDAASRELASRYQLAQLERDVYRSLNTKRQRQWILGRMVAKDAVRGHLWERNQEDIYPAEVVIENTSTGAPYAVGHHGRMLPPMHVSIAHVDGFAVAIARPNELFPGGVGIDTEELRPVNDTLFESCLVRAEIDLLGEAGAAGEIRDRLFWRMWTAKEAVSKMDGQGLKGRIHDIRVISIRDTSMTLIRLRADRAETLHVVNQAVIKPDLAKETQYVVSWTADDSAMALMNRDHATRGRCQ